MFEQARVWYSISSFLFLDQNVCELINISMEFTPKEELCNKSSLGDAMGLSGEKPLSELMIVQFNYVCVHAIQASMD